jgi:hypothetical protein
MARPARGLVLVERDEHPVRLASIGRWMPGTRL